MISLRGVLDSDLPVFFQQQLDETANRMAAFTRPDPSDRQAFMAHWGKIRADEGITIRTILYDGQIAGYVLAHAWFGEPEVSYWLGRGFWGRGVATQALGLFLQELPTRPLHARVAADNLASRRVLEKNRFILTGRETGYANARGEEIVEFVLTLKASSAAPERSQTYEG